MTFREFRESGIDYDRKYGVLLESAASKGDGFEMAAYDCYRQYKCFCILQDIRESKIANKPMHYKMFGTVVETYSNGYARFYVATEDSWCGKRSTIGMYPIRCNIGYTRFYPRLNPDNTIDWKSMEDCDADIVNPDDIERLYTEQVKMNERLKQDIRDLVDRYSEERSKMPHLTESVYVRIG